MKKGSITPFCAISLMLVASLLFALLESARISRLDSYAALKAESGIDSLCASYQPFLWEQYGLLFLDGAYGAEEFSIEYVSEELRKEIEGSLDSYSFSSCNVFPQGYGIATDDKGALFLHYVAERQKENFPLGIAEDIYQQYYQVNEIGQQYSGTEKNIEEAKSVFANVKAEWQRKINALYQQEENKENSESGITITMPDTSLIENTWKVAGEMQDSNILNLIFGDVSEVSQKVCELENKLEVRKKESGTMRLMTEKNWYQKMLVIAYLEEYFSCFIKNEKSHFLDYEMEYVLCGKDSEWENLEEALKRILLIREAANTAYLVQDKEKMLFVELLTSVVALMTGENPLVMKTIQAGIIGAWAYFESILDIRALVAGEVIPLIKQENEWTTELKNILYIFDKEAKAKKCSTGLGYSDYLKQLLFMSADEKVAYRMMEVMEIAMKQQEAYENCKMDHMLVLLNYEVEFESKSIFQSFITTGKAYNGRLFFSKNVQRSYIP